MKITKKEKLIEFLWEKIEAGFFSSGPLPGERELAARFQLGRNTVRSALAVLDSEGWIDRRRKVGTMVKANAMASDKGLAGLIMRESGHMYADRSRLLKEHFRNAGFSVHGISLSPFLHDRNRRRAGLEECIRKLLKACPCVMVVDGYLNGVLPCRERVNAMHPIFIDFFDSGLDCRVKGVWCDYRKAGYLAGRHLMECGCRRPMLFSGYVPQVVRFNPMHWSHHREKLIIDGFRQAMEESGVDPETTIVCCTADTPRRHWMLLRQICLDRRRVPDGFCGATDQITTMFLKEVLENRKEVPGGLCLCGIGNTPSSRENCFRPFSSIDLNADAMASAVVSQTLLPPALRNDILIEPRLVAR